MSSQSYGPATFRISPEGQETFEIAIKGRVRWALECLIDAGAKGCTPFDKPGPRWAAYVHMLRTLSVPIKTVREKHPGPFKGTHARYVLKAVARRLEDVE